MGNFIDLTGKNFGSLKVIERAENQNKRVMWLCQCNCAKNTIKKVQSSHLISGKIISCGCVKGTKHGLSQTKIYNVYVSIKQRCYNENCDIYINYGERGIRVCEEWLGESGFISFYNWSNANGYKEGLSIDRIDVNGNYEPSNCRWATIKEQSLNKRSSTLLTLKGVTKNISEWSKEYNIPVNTIRGRIKKGKSLDDLFDK
jgi:hypothetical protein